jgi:hypothetical protein
MLVLGALTFRADAQAVKPAVGNEQVYWVLTVSVDKMDDFKSLVGKLVAATEKEPDALQYEYNVGDDHKTVNIYERAGKADALVIYGAPTDEFKKAVADFHPIYMTPIEGFIR